MELEKPVENVSESCQDVCLRAALDDLISVSEGEGCAGSAGAGGQAPQLGKEGNGVGLRVCPGRERGTYGAPRLQMKNRDGKSRA